MAQPTALYTGWVLLLSLGAVACVDEVARVAEGGRSADGAADGELPDGAPGADATPRDEARPIVDAAEAIDAAPGDAPRSDARSPDAAAPAPVDAPCPPGEAAGGFQVRLREGFSSVTGRLRDGVPPWEVWDPLEVLGDCTLRVAPALSCDPPCAGGEACGPAGCEPAPAALPAGTIRLSGLSAPVEMEPTPAGIYSFGGDLPHPAFGPGDPISLVADGGAHPAFALETYGVAPLETDGEGVMGSGAGPVVVTWRPGEGGAEIRLVLEVGHHGGFLAELECVVPDAGAYAVPRQLVDALYAQGIAGFPVVELVRFRAASTRVEGRCVELVASSGVVLDLLIDGVRSCSLDEDCPGGEACGPDLLCVPTEPAPDGGTTPAPDGGTTPPDAALPEPDAALPEPDAALPEPDAALPEPDAALPEPDSALPEPDAAFPEPDAGAELPLFSFFVTSLEAMRELSGSQDGFGGDLGGLEGADTICQQTAARSGVPGSDQKVWRAFLSAARAGPGGAAVHAIERVGAGPWYDANGRLVAQNVAGLVAERPLGDPAVVNDLPNERGEGLQQFGDTHDILTGSSAVGRWPGGGPANACNDWTSSVGATGRPNLGHSWPARSGTSWMRAHPARGCAPGVNLIQNGPGVGDTVGAGGGWGAIYCFALTP